MTAFAAHMQALAKDFIGTVLFVDDQISTTVRTYIKPTDVAKKTSLKIIPTEIDALYGAISDAESIQVPGETVTNGSDTNNLIALAGR